MDRALHQAEGPTARATCRELILEDGNAPEWVALIPAGELKGFDGRTFVNDRPQGVVDAFERHPHDIPLDWEHTSERAVEDQPAGPNPSPAAGWIVELQVREGEIWGRVEWTDSGRASVAARDYRYVSPAILHKKDGRVMGIVSAGLTNRPNLDLPALNRLDHSPEARFFATENFVGSPRSKYGTHGSKGFKGNYAQAWRIHFSQVAGGALTAAASGPIRGTVRRTEMIAASMKPKCNLPAAENLAARTGAKSPLPGDFPKSPSDYGLSSWASPSDDDLTREDIQLSCKDLAVIKSAASRETKRRIADREAAERKKGSQSMDPQLLALLGLDEAATEESAIEAVTALNAKATKLDEDLKISQTSTSELTEQVTEEKAKSKKLTEELALAQASRVTPDLDKWVPRADFDAARNRNTELQGEIDKGKADQLTAEIDTVIAEAKKAGKITPATEEYYKASCAQEGGLERFKKFVESAPPVVTDPALPATPPGVPGAELSDEELSVCAMTGADPARMALFKKDPAEWAKQEKAAAKAS